MLQLVEIVRPVVREHFFHCFNIKAYYLFPEGDIEPVQIERGYTGEIVNALSKRWEIQGKAGKMVLHEGAYCGKCRLIGVVGGKRDYESHSRAKLRLVYILKQITNLFQTKSIGFFKKYCAVHFVERRILIV